MVRKMVLDQRLDSLICFLEIIVDDFQETHVRYEKETEDSQWVMFIGIDGSEPQEVFKTLDDVKAHAQKIAKQLSYILEDMRK